MSKEEKNAPVKPIEKAKAIVRPVKNLPAKNVPSKRVLPKHVPAVHVLTTFTDLMEDFRKNFIENIAFPFDWIDLETVAPVREATVDLVDEGNRFVVQC